MKENLFFDRWEGVRADLLSTMAKFSDEDLAFTPFKGAMSVGQIICHIGDAEEGWFRYVIQHLHEEWPGFLKVENYPTLEKMTVMLSDVHAQTEGYLNSLTASDLDKVIHSPWDNKFPLGWIIWHVMEHEIHHRGELSLILGMLGREGLEV